MAVEGAVVDVPAGSPAVDKPAGGAAPDPKASPDAGGKPAASQPDPKWEDDPRVKGMLADLKKEREARQKHEAAIAAKEAEAVEWKRKVEALTGLKPQPKEEADAALVKQKLAELYPELADLGSISEIKAALEEQQVQSYATHSRGMLAKVYDGIAAEYGDLTERQKRRIDAAYFHENRSNPEFHQRHNQGDPTLIAQFVKEMVEDLVEPIRKKVTASEANRFRPVPGGRDRSTPLKGEKPKTGEDMLRAHFREKSR